MNETMNTNTKALSDDELAAASGGAIPWYTNAQYSYLSASLASVILQILAATEPSYNYSDVSANFMSLILEYGEYYFGYNGKSVDDPKAKAIRAVLEAKGVDMTEVCRELDKSVEFRD